MTTVLLGEGVKALVQATDVLHAESFKQGYKECELIKMAFLRTIYYAVKKDSAKFINHMAGAMN